MVFIRLKKNQHPTLKKEEDINNKNNNKKYKSVIAQIISQQFLFTVDIGDKENNKKTLPLCKRKQRKKVKQIK